MFLASPDTVNSVLAGGYIHPILSVSSIVGFVTVIGFAIRSGLILLNRYRSLEEQGMSTIDAIRDGSRERVIPIMMTSLTTMLAMVPLLFTHDFGSELQRPLAIAMISTMTVGTLVSLFVIPLIYWFIYRNKTVHTN